METATGRGNKATSPGKPQRSKRNCYHRCRPAAAWVTLKCQLVKNGKQRREVSRAAANTPPFLWGRGSLPKGPSQGNRLLPPTGEKREWPFIYGHVFPGHSLFNKAVQNLQEETVSMATKDYNNHPSTFCLIILTVKQIKALFANCVGRAPLLKPSNVPETQESKLPPWLLAAAWQKSWKKPFEQWETKR